MNNKKINSDKEEFERYLQKIEDPKRQSQINRNLPRNSTPLQVAKYKLCKQILGYKLDNDFSREQVAEQIGLSKAETEDILFCEIEKFTLDRLLTYASQLFYPTEINIILDKKKDVVHAS